MTNVYDFDQYERDWVRNAAAQSFNSFDKNPDDVAKAFAYSKDTGAPASVIHDNLDDFESDYKAGLASQIIRNNPAITSFINAHPLHAGLIHDDLGNLDKLTETFRNIHSSPESPLRQGIKGFAEAFGSDYPGTVYLNNIDSSKYPITASLLAPLGIPLELMARTFSGVLGGTQAAVKGAARQMGAGEQGATKFANDLTGMLEYHMLTGAGRMRAGEPVQEIIPPEGKGPEAKVPAPTIDLGRTGLGEYGDKIQQEAITLRPFFEAGEEPPPGVSELADKARAEQAKLDQKSLDNLVSDAEATNLKERSREKFQEFLGHLPDGTLRISAEAVRKLYGDKLPEAGDNLLGWVPGLADRLANEEAVGGSIEVSTKEFLANVDKDVFKQLRDDIAIRDGDTVNETKELEPSVIEPVPSGDPALDAIRKGAGFETPPPEPLEGVKDERLFTRAKAIGRTEKELKRYQELIAQRDAEDVAYRQARAEKQAKLENSAEWKAEAALIRPEVQEEIVSRPEIKAYQLFSEGKTIAGETLPRKPKFARDSLTEDQLKDVPEKFVSSRGIHPDDMASLLGFDSGKELVATLGALEREAEGFKGDIVKRLVDAEIHRRVNAKIGELATERLEEAKDHALSMTQMEMLHEQVVALGARIGMELPITKQQMEFGANRLLGEQRFGSLKSSKTLALAGKAGRAVEKALLSDKPLDAFKAAQQQYILSRMAREALTVERERKAFDKVAKKFSKRDVGWLDAEYTNFIHDILLRIGKSVNRTPEDLATEIQASEYKSLQDFLGTKKGMGHDINVPDFLVDPKFKKNLDDMSVSEAREAMAGVRSLAKVGRDERKVGRAGEKLDVVTAINQLVEQLSTLGEVGTVEAKGIHKLARTFLAGTLQPESIINRWDRGDAFGIFNNIVGRPLFESANYESKLAKDIARKILALEDKADLKEVIPNDIFKDPHSAHSPTPENAGNMDWDNALPKPMTRKNLRAVLLNAGNEDNLFRLAKGYNLEPPQVLDWLNQHATKQDWDWAQAFGNIFKDLKKLSDELARKRSVLPPESVQLQPIDTPHGQYEGWYWPIIHDPTWSGGLEKAKAGEPLFSEDYVRAGTAKGYTKSRTGYIGPLSLELDAIPGRLMQEIHDIAFRDAVVNASKVFYNKSFINAVSKYYGKEYGDLFIPWLKDIANSSNGNSAADHTWARWSEFVRQNIVGTLVGLNIRTVQKHTLSAAMNSITEVGGLNFLDATRSLTRRDFDASKSNWEFAISTSEELQRRSQNFVEQVSGAQEKVLDGRNLRSTLLHAGTAPVAFFDLLSAVPTWMAEYKTQIESGASRGDSIYAADRAVRRAHGSSVITNRPELMRRQPWLASLYGFFNHIANRQFELAWKAKEAAGQAKAGEAAEAMKQVPHLMVGLFSYVIFPAIVEELVTPMTNDEKESWGKKAAKGLVRGASSSWIGVRDLANAALNAKDGTLGLASTAPTAMTNLIRDVFSPKTEFGFDKAHAGKTLKHGLTAFGMMTGLTNAAEGNLAEYLWNLKTGKERTPKDLKELYRGVTKGESRPKSGPDILERLLPGREIRR